MKIDTNEVDIAGVRSERKLLKCFCLKHNIWFGCKIVIRTRESSSFAVTKIKL